MHPNNPRNYSHLHELLHRLVVIPQTYPILGFDDCEYSAQLRGKGGRGGREAVGKSRMEWGEAGGRACGRSGRSEED